MSIHSDIPVDLVGDKRLSARHYISENQYSWSIEDAVSYTAKRLHAAVHQKLAGRPVKQAYYYVTYEVVLDDSDRTHPDPDGGSSGEMRASAVRAAA